LSTNVLRIGDGQLEVPFLSEKDIPNHLFGQVPESLASGADNLPAPSIPATSFPEATIENLMSMGSFSRNQVITALSDCAGNEDQAASQLLSQMEME
jgi:hypothetical protein